MVINTVRYVHSAAKVSQLPSDGLPEVAFIGRSNVGKSSLLNMLVGRKGLARISSVPGKTRTVNSYLINEELYFQDLPGLGYAKVSKKLRREWMDLIVDYLTSRQPLVAVIHLIDSRHSPMPVDRELLIMMRPSPVRYLVALTKVDKLSGNKLVQSRRRMEKTLFECGVSAPITLTSARKRRGKKEILGHIESWIR